jgi:hypothetical protein
MPQMPAYNAQWHEWDDRNQASQQRAENLPQDDLFGPIMYVCSNGSTPAWSYKPE